MTAKALGELFVGIILVGLISYIVARSALGNPFIGLGVQEQLSPAVEKELVKIYGLNESLALGSLGFLSGLFKGTTGQSIVYNSPAFSIAVYSILWTLLAILPGFLLGFLASMLWFTLYGSNNPATAIIRRLSFIPGYIYAVIIAVSSWLIGWPSPLPSTSTSKIIAYTLVIFLVAWTRLLHGLIGIVDDSINELSGYTQALRAMAYPEYKINQKLIRVVMPSYSAYATTLLGMTLERSVILEPLIGYVGIGMILYRSVIMADPVLAATAFTLLGSIGYLMVIIGRVLEPTFDPRLRG